MARFEMKRNTWLVGLSGLAALMLSTAVWADATATEIAPADDSGLVVVDDGSGDGTVADSGSDGSEETGVDTGTDETAVDTGSDGTDEVVVDDGSDDEAVTDTGVDDAVVDGTVIRDGSGDGPVEDTGLDGTGDTGVFVIDGWAGNGGVYYFTDGNDDPVLVYDLGEVPAVDDGSDVTSEPVVDQGTGDDVLLDENGLPVLYAVDPIYTLDPDACIDCFVITSDVALNNSAVDQGAVDQSMVERGGVAQFEDVLPTSSGSGAVAHDSSPQAADLCDPAVVSLLCELKTGTSN